MIQGRGDFKIFEIFGYYFNKYTTSRRGLNVAKILNSLKFSYWQLQNTNNDKL